MTPETPRLGGILTNIVDEITADTELHTSVGFSGRVDTVSPDLAQQAQAVLREAVSNTVRHAGATELGVTITVGADLVLDVTDNGIGIPTPWRAAGCTTSSPGPRPPAAAASSNDPRTAAPI